MSEAISFSVETYQNKDGLWVGVVMRDENSPMVRGIAMADKERAIRNVKRAFYGVIACSHKMTWSEWQQIGQDRMGNDLYGHVGECPKCGFETTFECEPETE